MEKVPLVIEQPLYRHKSNATTKMCLDRDMTDRLYHVGARGTGRAEPRAVTRVLLPPIQFRKRHQTPNPPINFFSFDEYEDEDEDADDEDFYTPDPVESPDMDVYSSGDYSGDSNMSSEVDDDMDFYEVESSQPPVTADAVRSLYAFCSCPTCRPFADLRSYSHRHSHQP
jgi:hypothetical protein